MDDLTVLVITDFSKLGTLNVATMNKHVRLISKIVDRNQIRFLTELFMLLVTFKSFLNITHD
jgi:hypothetical protein